MTATTPGPKRIENILDIQNYLGVPLGHSAWVLVDQPMIDSFAAATGDDQWIHVNPQRARDESPFGKTVAHGYLTLALLPSLLPQILRVDHCSMVLNYGIDRVRLPSPVLSGSRIRLAAQFKNVRELPNGAARVVTHFRFEIEKSTKPACTGDVVYVYYP